MSYFRQDPGIAGGATLAITAAGDATHFATLQIHGAAIRANSGISDLHFDTQGKTDAVVIQNNTGNVGIGTLGPGSQLHVYGSAGTGAPYGTGGTILAQDSGGLPGNGGGILFGAIHGQGYFSGIKGYVTDGGGNSVGDLVFYTRYATGDASLTERMRITSSGRVGIGTGTASPAAKLDVNGDARIARWLTQANDAGVALTSGDFGRTITVNSGSAQTITLPGVSAADIGATVTVVKLGAGQVTIQAAASTYIADSGAGGTVYNSGASGESYANITLRLATSSKWIIAGGDGSWTTTN